MLDPKRPRLLHFKYAHPTKSDESDTYQSGQKKIRRKKVKHYSDVSPIQKSVFYYWYEFLRRNTDYKKTCKNNGKGKLAKLYKDFGNVHANDGKNDLDSFWIWWKKHAYLFAQDSSRRIVEMKDVTHPNEDADLVISVPLELSRSEIKRQFQHMLNKHEKRAETARAADTAPYPVYTKPVVMKLHQVLAIYDAVTADPDAKYYEIFDQLSDRYHLYVDDSLAGLVTEKEIEQEKRVIKRRKTQFIYREYRSAVSYIENVALGEFPKK